MVYTRHRTDKRPPVGALGKEAHDKLKRDSAAAQQRRRDKLALEGLTPLDFLSEGALANYQQGHDSSIGGAYIKQPRRQLRRPG